MFDLHKLASLLRTPVYLAAIVTRLQERLHDMVSFTQGSCKPQECPVQDCLWRLTVRQGYTWLLSDVNYEPFVGRSTLHVPILGMHPGACLLLDSIEPVIRPPRVVVEEDQVFDFCCYS